MMQIGEKINRLKLIEWAGRSKWHNRIGLFECECGNTKEISIGSVEQGLTKSCGCLRLENIMKVGEKRNRLTLVKYIGIDRRSRRIGLFECECGNIKKLRISHVEHGSTKSCGCLNRERVSEAQIKLLIDGKHQCRGNRGIFISEKQNINITYDSSYEEKALNVWETDPTVKSFNRSRDRITYVNPVDGSSHVYLPDFIVNDTRMIEIKPQYQLDDPVVQAKALAAEEYCSERGMTYEIWTEHELGLMK